MNVVGFFSRLILYSALAGIVLVISLFVVAVGHSIQYPLDLECVLIKGHSMEPVLMDGQRYAFDKDFQFFEIEVGSIVNFHDTNYLNRDMVAHEVVAINGNQLSTRGRNNPVNDEPISYWQIESIYAGKPCSPSI